MTQNMKVALLFVAAVAGLVAIILLLTGGVIRGASTLYVTYNFAGGVQTGTPVRVAGIQVGKVRKIEFLGGDPTADTHVRLTVDVDSRALESVRADSNFYINMAGIIGERYVEITTGSKDAPALQDGDTVRGVDPPRLDQLISQGYAVAGELLDIIEKNRAKIEGMIDALDAFLQNFDLKDIGDVAKLVTNASALMSSLNRDLPPVLRKASPLLDDLGPTLKNVNSLLGDASELLGNKDVAKLISQLLGILDNVEGTLKGADTLVNNLTFVDENWLRHFLQVEGVKAYASFGSPDIPKGSVPVTPPPVKLPEIPKAPAMP